LAVLSDEFYQQISSHPIPTDLQAFYRSTFCSGGSRSDYESIAYINHKHFPTIVFLNNSALFVANWWGNWWGRQRLPIRALMLVAARCVVASEPPTDLAGGIR